MSTYDSGREGHQAPPGEPGHGGGAGPSMAAAAELFKALAHPARAQVLELLSQGDSSIAELCQGTGVKASHLSRHLTQTRGQHLIQRLWSEGRLVYRLAYPEAADLLAAARSVSRHGRQKPPPPCAPRRRNCCITPSLTSRSQRWRPRWHRVR
jgi:DNA-binding transcriptional ArsR family regulator